MSHVLIHARQVKLRLVKWHFMMASPHNVILNIFVFTDKATVLDGDQR